MSAQLALPDEEKGTQTPSRPDSSDNDQLDALKDSELEWHYLTWETCLPPVPRHGILDGVQEPDLARYQNPFDWPDSRKLTLVWISTVATAFTAYCAGMYAACVDQLSDYFGTSRVATLVGITIFTIGFGIAPMVLAPFSEIAGRRPIFVITGLLWLVFQICCAVTRIYGGMLVARLLAGCAASTFSTMVGGVVADMYRGHNRNAPMTIFTGGVLFGTGLGPLVSGFIAQRTTWRWVFWSHSIVVAVLLVLIYFFFYESRGSVLLSRKATTLNQWYEAREAAGIYGVPFSTQHPEDRSVAEAKSRVETRRIRWRVREDEQRSSILTMIRISVARPFTLLLTEPVVAAFSLFISFSWAVLYLTFSAVPYVFQTTYGFTLEQADAIFAATAVASILSTLLSIWQERFASRRGLLQPGPEQRLTFCCYEALALPAGLFLFGWAGAFPSVPWIFPALGLGLATLGIFQIYLATFNYLADSYGPYASSAIAAQSFCRNLLGGAFPLFTEQMYVRLGIGPASSLLGGVAVLLCAIPWVLLCFGPRIRARSRICSQLMA